MAENEIEIVRLEQRLSQLEQKHSLVFTSLAIVVGAVLLGGGLLVFAVERIFNQYEKRLSAAAVATEVVISSKDAASFELVQAIEELQELAERARTESQGILSQELPLIMRSAVEESASDIREGILAELSGEPGEILKGIVASEVSSGNLKAEFSEVIVSDPEVSGRTIWLRSMPTGGQIFLFADQSAPLVSIRAGSGSGTIHLGNSLDTRVLRLETNDLEGKLTMSSQDGGRIRIIADESAYIEAAVPSVSSQASLEAFDTNANVNAYFGDVLASQSVRAGTASNLLKWGLAEVVSSAAAGTSTGTTHVSRVELGSGDASLSSTLSFGAEDTTKLFFSAENIDETFQ